MPLYAIATEPTPPLRASFTPPGEPGPSEFDPGESDQTEPSATTHRLRFEGEARSYFRLWFTNLVLTLLTLGVYTPYARRRSVQYFYAHTNIVGSPLEFTAQTRSMMLGFLVAVVLIGLYILSQIIPWEHTWGLIVLLAALWTPLAWMSAMRFRLAHTRWRGLRLQFMASWPDTYRAWWPLFAQAVLLLGLPAVFSAQTPDTLTGWFGDSGLLEVIFGALRGKYDTPLRASLWATLGVGAVFAFVCAVRLDANVRDLLVRHARLGAQTVSWARPSFGTFARIWLLSALSLLLALLSTTVLAGWAFASLTGIDLADWYDKPLTVLARQHGPIVIVWLMTGVLLSGLALLMLSVCAFTYYRVRCFQLRWSRLCVHLAAGDSARFACTLRLAPYLSLRLKNTLLCLLTLGFYGPFARLAQYRMTLESVTLHLPGKIESLVGEQARAPVSGVGDALAASLGLEFGL